MKKKISLEAGVIWSFSLAYWSLKDCLGVPVSFSFFLHHKNTFLPLQSTKFKVVDQWLSWFFISFLIVKIFCCPRDQKNIRLLDKRFFCFPIIHVEWKYVFNLRKNKTKKTCIWGYFCTFTPIFCVITKVIGSILIFSRCLLKF